MQVDFRTRLTALCGYGALGDFAEAAGIHQVNLSRQIAPDLLAVIACQGILVT